DVELPATVLGIGAMARTATFRASYVGEIPVRLKLDKMENRVIPDLTASAEITLHTAKDRLVAPRASVFQENGGNSFVFLQGPEGWIRKEIEIELGNNVSVAVRSGLQKGDVVALQRPL